MKVIATDKAPAAIGPYSQGMIVGSLVYTSGQIPVNPVDNSIHKAKPCPLCARMIIQAGIENVYMRVGDGADNYVVVPAKELEWVQEKEV